MVAAVIPIGQFVGTMAFPDGNGARSYGVRLGLGVEELHEEEFGVWALAHGGPHMKDITKPAVENLATKLEISEAGPVFERLLRRGLLARVMPVGAPARRFAEHHQLLPLGVGLGNSAGDLAKFGVGEHDFPRATLGPALFDLWAFSMLSPSLWHACEESDALEEGAMPADLLQLLLKALPVLISTDAAVVDLSRAGMAEHVARLSSETQ